MSLTERTHSTAPADLTPPGGPDLAPGGAGLPAVVMTVRSRDSHSKSFGNLIRSYGRGKGSSRVLSGRWTWTGACGSASGAGSWSPWASPGPATGSLRPSAGLSAWWRRGGAAGCRSGRTGASRWLRPPRASARSACGSTTVQPEFDTVGTMSSPESDRSGVAGPAANPTIL